MQEVRYTFDAAAKVATFAIRTQGPLNTIGGDFLAGLEEAARRAAEDGAEGVVLVSTKPKSFLDGANLEEIRKLTTPGAVAALLARFHAAMKRLAAMPAPVVAILDGQSAMGGGFELILLSCDRVVCTKDSTLGLPETGVGLIPAGGGTWTLRRAVGLKNACDIILGGRALPPDLYARHGLVTVAPREELGRLAREWLAANRGAVNRNLDPRHAEPEPLGDAEREKLFASLRARFCVSPSKPYLAAALDAIEAGARCGLDEALAVETDLFARLMFDENSRSKMGLFFLARSIGPNLVKIDPASVRALPRVAVLGAGLMGRGIAQVTADGGVETLLVDVSEEVLAASKAALAASLDRLVAKGTWSAGRRDALLGRVRTCADYGALADVPLVIEAVPESLELKRKVLARVQEVNPRAIFATNTSAIPVEDIAEGSPSPAGVVGMHYFSPVPLMPLLEVIRGKGSSRESVDTAVWLGRKQKKTCVVVASSPGFYTSRLFGSFVVTGFDLAERGADPYEADRAALEAGFPKGPFYMFGAVGSLVVYHAGRFMAERMPGRHPLPASLGAVVEAGFTGAGKRSFYLDEEGTRPDREACAHIGVRAGGPVPTREEMRDALLLSMVSEAFQAYGEGVVGDLVSMDLAAALGVGFPDCWQGPVRYTGCKGVRAVVRRLRELHDKFAIPVLAPPEPLLRMERLGIDRNLI